MSIGVLINHIIAFLTSPISVSLLLIIAGLILRKRKFAIWLPIAGVVFLAFMSTGIVYRVLGLHLERQYPPVRVEELPEVNAIVVLGGGVGSCTNVTYYPELYMSADRVTHAARIWKAGKAPTIITSGNDEAVASLPYLLELGIPEKSIVVENESGNTEENAKFTARYLKSVADPNAKTAPKIILVTSAWHMRRALLMFHKYAPEIEIVPAACDYEAMVHLEKDDFLGELVPNAGALLLNSYMLKEYIGYWGYRLLR